ncbi:glycosyltransferase family 8 protein [Pleomassaria siparia CBS 279.74]|uniref:glycogenin glucosyltransferase n=1 Tax=Pleomassaria siparia CBS 279.74 TaxID=1314801 RepID=A0A6G1KJF5_9PLEO|nr:glycosyltransferase family 8 protein [Pleomassaria siparia CBS 279.74]
MFTARYYYAWPGTHVAHDMRANSLQLLMSDSYLPGAAVLAHSLRDAGTTKKLAVLATLDTLSADTVSQLKKLYDYVIPVDRIRSPNTANLYLMGRPDLAFAFTKIALWRQVQFRKIVYLDADVVTLRALDELFDLPVPFAAAPDIGWPDAFNSGVMVISPNMGEYWALQTLAAAGDSFDGADQGLLNQYYEHKDWHRLSFIYNCTPNAQYQWEPAYRYYKRDISVVHFIGKDKPWSTGRAGPSNFGVYNELLARWWAVYDRHLKVTSGGTGIQQHVRGERTSSDFGLSSIQHLTVNPDVALDPPASTEPPLSEPGEVAENIDQGVVEPTPTVEQRQFSAPEMAWDATKFEPPAESRPEAANFPTHQYGFSQSSELFQAPPSYPEPPKDMWYQVPDTKPSQAQMPNPIFPWERQLDRPKATRVFAEDLPPAPTSITAPIPTHPFSTTHFEQGAEPSTEELEAVGLTSPPRISSPKSADDQWQSFQQSSVNAWDGVPGIDTYVRAIFEAQNRRGSQQLPQQSKPEEVLSPPISRKPRRESLIITDFPSALERPSLPVTPAPIKRPTFWGEDRDVEGDLPVAEGVPQNVAEWVCPKCHFSSFNASDFHRPRREASITSATTAIATPSPSIVHAAALQPPSATEVSPKSSPRLSPSKTVTTPTLVFRPGVSLRGAPLASLTDPSILDPQPRTHFPGLSVPSSSASDLEPVLAS